MTSGPEITRRSLLAAGGAAGLGIVGAGLLGAGSAAASTTPGGGWTSTPLPTAYSPLPTQLAHIGTSTQVVIVVTSSWTAIHGSIQAWELVSGTWTRVLAPQPSNIGLRGWVPAATRVQGDHKTPAGTFRIHKAFGYSADPGSGLPYAQTHPNYYWAGDQRDPKTYNIMQTHEPATMKWRTSESEALYYTRPAYQYAACIDFNLAGGIHQLSDGQWVATTPANIHLGSAIFLHCYGETGPHGYTLGCANASPSVIQWLLRWFRPEAVPRIVMGPSTLIRTM